MSCQDFVEVVLIVVVGCHFVEHLLVGDGEEPEEQDE